MYIWISTELRFVCPTYEARNNLLFWDRLKFGNTLCFVSVKMISFSSVLTDVKVLVSVLLCFSGTFTAAVYLFGTL